MLDGLKAALDDTGLDFAFAAWSHSPETDYGVYMLREQTALSADEDAGAEVMLEGFIDYFTRDDSLYPKTTIENALRKLGIYWRLNSVQYEDDTGYIHYEWEWRNSNGEA